MSFICVCESCYFIHSFYFHLAPPFGINVNTHTHTPKLKRTERILRVQIDKKEEDSYLFT